jgi:phosphorylase kinase alpha/beta subunit
MHFSPSQIRTRLHAVLADYQVAYAALRDQETLRANATASEVRLEPNDSPTQAPEGGWWQWRQLEGTLNRTPETFYPHVWQLFKHCKGIVIGDKLERRNRLDSDAILSEMTPQERNFALRIEHLLNKIISPEYRQVTIEGLETLAQVVRSNRELFVDDVLVMDVIVGHAVRLAWLAESGREAVHYEGNKAHAWAEFYERPPRQTRQFLGEAFRYLLVYGDEPLLEAST